MWYFIVVLQSVLIDLHPLLSSEFFWKEKSISRKEVLWTAALCGKTTSSRFLTAQESPWMGGNAQQYPKCRREKVAALATPMPAGAIMNVRLSAAHNNLNSWSGLCVSLSTLPGLMHHLYNRGFALAVSMPKLVPLVIVYLCGLIAGGGLQVLILPNAMGHKKAHIHSSHLLPWNAVGE